MTEDQESVSQLARLFVRRARAEDLPALIRLAETTFTAARWSRETYDAYCRGGSGGQALIANILLVACIPAEGQQIVGFAALQTVVTSDECEVQNIVVDPGWRRHGIGQRLLSAGLLWWKTWMRESAPESCHRSLQLEVRASNEGAINFYKRMGFAEVGKRPAYYSRPTENAILMELRPSIRF